MPGPTQKREELTTGKRKGGHTCARSDRPEGEGGKKEKNILSIKLLSKKYQLFGQFLGRGEDKNRQSAGATTPTPSPLCTCMKGDISLAKKSSFLTLDQYLL